MYVFIHPYSSGEPMIYSTAGENDIGALKIQNNINAIFLFIYSLFNVLKGKRKGKLLQLSL